jgi:O-antigen/teichoic acid export membrane protein
VPKPRAGEPGAPLFGWPRAPSVARGRTRLVGTGSTSAVKRAALTTIDQCFSSASNFVVGVVVAQISGPAGLGAYALAYTAWLMTASLHRALITDPMSIHGDARRDDSTARLGTGVAAEIALGLCAGAVVLVVAAVLLAFNSRTFGLAMLALAPWLPFLLIQDFWRWAGFMRAAPQKALANDTVFNVVQGTVMVLLLWRGLRSPEMVIAAWGVGALAGAAYGLHQFAVRRVTRGGIRLLRDRWHMSKWLTAGVITSFGSSQAYPFITGAILGPVGLGGLRAAQTLVMGPSMVLVQAGGSIGLPEASRGLADGGWSGMRRVTRWVTLLGLLSVGLVCCVVFAAGQTLLSVLYGNEFAQYWIAADLIAVATLVQTFSLGAVLVLKTTKRTREYFNVGLVQLAVSPIALVVLSLLWGVNGAATAMILTAIVVTVALLRAQRHAERTDAPQPGDDAGATDHRAASDGERAADAETLPLIVSRDGDGTRDGSDPAEREVLR